MSVRRSALIFCAVFVLGACSLNPLRFSRMPDAGTEPSIAVEPATSGNTAPSATSAPPKAATARPDSPGATSRRGAYYMDDGPGSEPAPDHRAVPDAQPRREPLLGRANRPYVVFGRNYQPMTALIPYRRRGFASWYGRKFHGQKTASGEVYNMYAMTAAHPTLPIPSYVRVTNTRSGERVVVRVNDRGPFLNDRLIDLSYTAAAKLGYIQAGSAEVDVELLSFQDVDAIPATASIVPSATAQPTSAREAPGPTAEPREERLQVEITVKQDEVTAVPNAKSSVEFSAEKSGVAPTTGSLATVLGAAVSGKAAAPVSAAVAPAVAAPVAAPVAAAFAAPVAALVVPAQPYLQLGAFSTSESAESTREKVRKQLDWFKQPIEIISETGLFKLRAGPYGNRSDANAIAERIRVATGSKPFLMMR